MYHMIEKGIRGGISMISHRLAKANNPSMENYNASQPMCTLIYIDAKALYSKAMSLSLPISNYVWLTKEQIKNFDLHYSRTNENIGYVLEVDLEYPKELHNKHNDYPLAPEHMLVTNYMLSPFQDCFLKNKSNVKKLIPNLLNKTKYVVHYKTLQLYLNLGNETNKYSLSN